MQVGLLSILFAVAAFLGLLLFTLLVFRDENRSHTGRILGFYVLCFALFSIHNLLLGERYMLGLPFLYRITKPLMYAVAPLVFLYIRGHVYKEVRFRRGDWLFFLPVLLHAIELLPFYTMPRAEKLVYLEEFYANMNKGLEHNEGVLRPFIHPVVLFLYALVLYTLSLRLLSNAGLNKSRLDLPQNRRLMNWLRFFLWANILHFIVLVIHIMTYKVLPVNTFLLNNVEAAFILVSTALVLFFQPSILYGFRGEAMIMEAKPVGGNGDKGRDEQKQVYLPEEKRLQYLASIRLHFGQNQPYLQPGYSIKQLSEDTGIPYSYLSQVINQEYGMNFNELVNSYRVEYVKKLMEEPDAQNYTLEALAERSGFSSRATFSRAFARFAGCTPSDHFRKISRPNNGFVSNT